MDLATLEAKYLLKELLKMYEILNFTNFWAFRLDLQKTSSAIKEEAWDTYKLKKTNKFKSLVSRKSKRNTEDAMKQFMKLMNKEEILEADFVAAMEVLDRLYYLLQRYRYNRCYIQFIFNCDCYLPKQRYFYKSLSFETLWLIDIQTFSI